MELNLYTYWIYLNFLWISELIWIKMIAVGQAQFQGLNILFQYFYYSKFEKYKSCTSYSPNFSRLYQVVDNFKRDNFTFGKMFKFPTEFELKIWELNCIWIWFKFLKEFKPFGKHFLSSPNFFLNMIFNTVNWDWLTCIPKFEVPLQVVNMT
jgi:hypothetical protein